MNVEASPFSRRKICGGIAGLSLLSLARGAVAAVGDRDAARFAPPQSFSWEALTARVRALAGKPYDAQASSLGAHDVDFDAAGKLTYGPATPMTGTVRLLPVNRYAPIPVKLNVLQSAPACRLCLAIFMVAIKRSGPARLSASAKPLPTSL